MSDDVKAVIHPHDAIVARFLQHYGMPSRAAAAYVLNAAVAAGMMPPAEVERLQEALNRYGVCLNDCEVIQSLIRGENPTVCSCGFQSVLDGDVPLWVKRHLEGSDE